MWGAAALPLQFEVGGSLSTSPLREQKDALGGVKEAICGSSLFTEAIINTAGVACLLTALLQEEGLGPRPRSKGLQRGEVKGVSVSVELNILTVNSNL